MKSFILKYTLPRRLQINTPPFPHEDLHINYAVYDVVIQQGMLKGPSGTSLSIVNVAVYYLKSNVLKWKSK